MKKTLAFGMTGLACTLLAACANPIHSAWAYKPLQDAKSGAFEPAPKKLDYREFDTIGALADAEADMSRQGFVMIGYVNMYSPQFEMVGRGGAKKWGSSVGASHALHTFGRGHYLASYWARPKSLPLGAFYVDRMPDDARHALDSVFDGSTGVLVETVVTDSPAYFAGIRPGDLLIELNREKITSSGQLHGLLQGLRGQRAEMMIWSMNEGPPRRIGIALN